MFYKDLVYKYHDACLLEISLGPRQEATLTFDLYPIFYPEKPRIAVRLGGIFDFDAVTKYFHNIQNEPCEPDSYLVRCDAFQMEEGKVSKENDLHLLLEVEIFGKICIHCKNVSEIILQS